MLRACVDAGVIQRLAALAFALATLSVLALAFVRFPIVGFWALELAVACLPAVVAVAGEGRAISVCALSAAFVALAAFAAFSFAAGKGVQRGGRGREAGPVAGLGTALSGRLEVPDQR